MAGRKEKRGITEPNTTSPTEEEEDTQTIRIGPQYQAVCPEFQAMTERNPDDLVEKSVCIWAPTEKLKDEEIDDFIKVAEQKGLNKEQAYGILHWHKHDMRASLTELEDLETLIIPWCEEDKELFEQALTFYGKDFNRIKDMLPDKSPGDIINYYYKVKNEAKGRKNAASKQKPKEGAEKVVTKSD